MPLLAHPTAVGLPILALLWGHWGAVAESYMEELGSNQKMAQMPSLKICTGALEAFEIQMAGHVHLHVHVCLHVWVPTYIATCHTIYLDQFTT